MHAQEQFKTQPKIAELESIRGLAALLVVAFHIPKWHPLLNTGLINNAYLMVELFFVLSGYVIHNAYANNINTKKDLIRFQFLRFGRLYPVHFVFLVTFIFVEAAKYFAQNKFGLSDFNSQPFRENGFVAIVQQIFLLQAIGPTGNAATFNAPSWTISVEFYTYLVFATCVLLAPRKKSLLFSLLASSALILLASGSTFGFKLFLRCLAGFFVGCLTASITDKLKPNVPRYASLLVFAAIVIFLQLKTPEQYDVVIYFLAAALIASLVLSSDGHLNRVLGLRALTWLGTISYAVYMSHGIAVWAMKQVVRVVANRPDMPISYKGTPQLGGLQTLMACGVLILFVLLLSALVNRLIENPMRERSRRFAFQVLK